MCSAQSTLLRFFQNFYGATWNDKRSPVLYHFGAVYYINHFAIIGEN